MDRRIDGRWYEGATQELYDFRLRKESGDLLSGGLKIVDSSCCKEGTWNLRNALLNDRSVEVMDLELGNQGLQTFFVQFKDSKMLLANVQNREVVHELTKETGE